MASIQKLKGNPTKYRAVIRRKGHPHRSKTFLTKRAADQWARRTEIQMEEDLATGREGKGDILRMKFSTLADAYMADPVNGWRGKDLNRSYQVSYWVKMLGSRRLDEINADHVQLALDRYREGRCRVFAGVSGPRCRTTTKEGRQGRSGASVNRMRSTLGAIQKYANTMHRVSLDWLTGTRREVESKGRTRFLTDEELHKLLAACKQSQWDRLHLLVLMAVTTGARQGERFVFHSLRHSAASFLAASGASLPMIGAVLGHKSLQSTRPGIRTCVYRPNRN